MFYNLWNVVVIEINENLSVLNLVNMEDVEKSPILTIFFFFLGWLFGWLVIQFYGVSTLFGFGKYGGCRKISQPNDLFLFLGLVVWLVGWLFCFTAYQPFSGLVNMEDVEKSPILTIFFFFLGWLFGWLVIQFYGVSTLFGFGKYGGCRKISQPNDLFLFLGLVGYSVLRRINPFRVI